jgi:hypothetical protein
MVPSSSFPPPVRLASQTLWEFRVNLLSYSDNIANGKIVVDE